MSVDSFNEIETLACGSSVFVDIVIQVAIVLIGVTFRGVVIKNVIPSHGITRYSQKNTSNLKNTNYGILKRTILKEIIQDGDQSHYRIRKKFKKEKKFTKFASTDKSSIIRTFNQLLKNGWLGLVRFDIKSGGTERHYGLTEEGIKQSLKYNPSNENFWQICINYLNRKYKIQKPFYDEKEKRIKFKNKKECIDLTVPELFKQQYPSLNFYKNYFNPFGTEKTFGLVSELVKNQFDFCKKVFPILLAYAVDDKEDIEKFWKTDKDLILKMYEYGLTYTVDESENEISIFGLLLLLWLLSIKYKVESQEVIDDLTSKIIKKNKTILPLVFSKWEKLRKIVKDDKKLLEILLNLFVLGHEHIIDLAFRYHEMRIIIDQYYIEQDHREKLEEIHRSGMSYISSWSRNNDLEKCLFDDILKLRKNFQKDEKYEGVKPYLQTIKKLHELDRMVGYYKWNELGFLDIDKDDSKGELFSIQNVISFYFYIQLKPFFYDNIKLQKFLEENEEIRNWLNQWFDVIAEYKIQSINKLKLRVIA